MANVKILAPFIIKWEGGFSDKSADKGGATMNGVTYDTFCAFRKEKGLPVPTIDDLKKISEPEWTEILKKKYWDYWQADNINSQAIANILVDWAFNSGAVTSIKSFQSLAGLKVDGVVGPITLGYINGHKDQTDLFNRIWTARKDFFTNIVKNNSTQLIFINGWLNRLYDMVKYNFKLTPLFP